MLLVAVVAVLAGVAVGLIQGRRLMIPLAQLAARAEHLGSRGSRERMESSGIEEIDRVAEMLEQSAVRVDRLIAAERQFASDASHQLRTPLTALSMRLEEIIAADDPRTVREEARSALAQVERLATVVEHLLDNVRDTNMRAGPVELDTVVLQQVVEWEPAFGAAERKIIATGTRGLIALATPSGLSNVIATLLENSLLHGGGTVTVSTRSTGISLVIEVTDEGPGVPPDLGARIFERSVSGRRGTGLGLAVARELAETDGGRLELVQQRPPVFALFLSSRPALAEFQPGAITSGNRQYARVGGWFRRGGDQKQTKHVPADVDLHAAADRRGGVSEDDTAKDGQGGELDDIVVVYIGEGQQMGQDPEPGLRMTWHQSDNHFGLLNSVRRLAEQAGGLDAFPFYLCLAIDEPHGPVPHACRLWFIDLPSAPNTPRA